MKTEVSQSSQTKTQVYFVEPKDLFCYTTDAERPQATEVRIVVYRSLKSEMGGGIPDVGASDQINIEHTTATGDVPVSRLIEAAAELENGKPKGWKL